MSNMFGQSLAIIALDRTAAGGPAQSVSFLLATRCPYGGFPVFFGEATHVYRPKKKLIGTRDSGFGTRTFVVRHSLPSPEPRAPSPEPRATDDNGRARE